MYIGNDVDLSNYEQIYPPTEPGASVHGNPPLPQPYSPDAMMVSSMPGIASAHDSFVRQFYRAGLPQLRLVFPVKR